MELILGSSGGGLWRRGVIERRVRWMGVNALPAAWWRIDVCMYTRRGHEGMKAQIRDTKTANRGLVPVHSMGNHTLRLRPHDD
jgi:hypothetical protein